jgi:quercetin dioxygenase-like cupin family protein
MQHIRLAEKLTRIHDLWSPKIVGDLDGMHVKLVKIQGEFVMHSHDGQDELFLVLRGTMELHFLDSHLTLHEGDVAIVPAGVKHKTSAKEEAHVLTVSAKDLVNTGDVRDARTVVSPARI